jgi:hypothetical protein
MQKNTSLTSDPHPGWLSRLVLLFRERRIRKTKEALAYWSARAEVWRQLCSGQHMSYERDTFVEAYANQKKYEARLSFFAERSGSETPDP